MYYGINYCNENAEAKNANIAKIVLTAGMQVVLSVTFGFSSSSPIECNFTANDVPSLSASTVEDQMYVTYSGSNSIISLVHEYNNSNNINEGVASLYINSELVENLQKINLIAQLEDNWNGNDAPAISSELIEFVSSIVKQLNKQPEIFPTACNSIQLEYETDNDKYLEIELSQQDYCKIFIIDETGYETTQFISATINEINKVVDQFYE